MLQSFVLHVDIGQEVQAEGKLLEAGQISQRLKLGVGVELAARVGVPLRTGKLQLTQAGQAAESLELGRLDQRAHQIYSSDAQIARGQVRDFPDSIAPALQRHTAP